MTDETNKRSASDNVYVPRVDMELGSPMSFNMEYGYLEAFVRGLKSGFISKLEYRQLAQVDTLDDLKTVLQDTDYCLAVQNMGKVTPSKIHDRCYDKFVQEFEFLRSQATGQLAAFIEMITYKFLIRNVVQMIKGIRSGSNPDDIYNNLHRLGASPHLKTMLTFDRLEGMEGLIDLYRVVLVDMPIAGYFSQYFEHEMKGGDPGKAVAAAFDEMSVTVIDAHIEKLWLEDFYAFCSKLGGTTGDFMRELLEFEADRRAIEIVWNSIKNNGSLNASVNRLARQDMFCSFGGLYPECTGPKSTENDLRSNLNFSKVSDENGLANALEMYPQYRDAIRRAMDKSMNTTLTDELRALEVKLLMQTYDCMNHFAAFYGFVHLKLIELDNIRSIASRSKKYQPIF